ncbi:S-adenosyl-L-methionine-dependent methyltransferase [Boletus reticuloceps]|uniref:S-adenosyl-L-methionine-dependent methyltransferase n=1 Tax=Boletus reticuloceps TaxID=495285 RepID=A0A8I2YUV0_9AGAM|nr:S-adenosyl-L-methionine-dependent methyltransferase [Boletus reticuloceps]
MSHPLSTCESTKSTFSLVAWADDAWTSLIQQIFHYGWTPLARLARTAVLSLMQRIARGSLRVITPKDVHQFPTVKSADDPRESRDEPKAELRVIKDVFWLRLFAMADLGFAEAYMFGEVECDDLVSLFKIFILNRQNMSELDSSASYLLRIPQKLTSWRFLSTLSNSRANVAAHYDISNESSHSEGFLSKDMTYSCAIFEDLDADLAIERPEQRQIGGQLSPPSNETQSSTLSSDDPSARDELYDAQIRKLNHIIAKAQISSGQKILEIGSGWGSMAILIAQRFPDTTIDTLTLSVQQQRLAQARIKKAGVEDRVTVYLMDYRAMPSSWKSSFDRVISVEMIENVGIEFLTEYWRVVDWAMKTHTSVGVVQVITIPEALFPGGALPSLTILLRSMEAGSSGRLVVDSVSNIGPHYARTLREWRRRFLDKFETVVVPALKAEHPTVMNGPHGAAEIEVFKRKWLYY